MDKQMNFERFSKTSDNMSLERAKEEQADIDKPAINGQTDSEDAAIAAITSSINRLDQNILAGGRDENPNQ